MFREVCELHTNCSYIMINTKMLTKAAKTTIKHAPRTWKTRMECTKKKKTQYYEYHL